MNMYTAEETLIQTIERLTANLMELEEVTQTEFIYGQKTAYVECLEWLREWRAASAHGLDYEIEKRFPLRDRPSCVIARSEATRQATKK